MKIPIAKTKLTDEEFKIISKPLKSGWLVQGEFVEEFEKRLKCQRRISILQRV